MTTRPLVTTVATALLATTIAAPSTASTSHPATCGATVTGEAHLAHNLNCPAGKGITLTGNTTLNLRGHTLTGPGATDDWTTGHGVTVSQTGTSQVINGTIRGWGIGIGGVEDVFPHPKVLVRDIRLIDNSLGIYALAFDVDVRRALLAGNAGGIEGFYRPTITVADSVIRDNGTGVSSSDGLRTITRSRLTGNRTAVGCNEGICDLSRNRIAGNDVGVDSFLSGPRMTSNDVVGNRIGVETQLGDVPSLTDNRFLSNGVGLAVASGVRLTVRGNTFVANRTGIGQASSGAEGYGGLLVGNAFKANGDGIDLPAATADLSLGSNRATYNRRWGIFAPGATDLGGNTARGNGSRPQCVGVVC